MGHALGDTLQDILIRRARMQGVETLWLPGTDHAGIATQLVVERELAAEGTTRNELGRDAFIERVWAWKERYGDRIVEQMKALGCSCDWDRLRFTMDEGLSRAVRVAFVRMYEDGLIYRGERIINWCPKDETALSDSEMEHEEVDGELVTFRYQLADGAGHVDVATTRIETMLGDTGVAVHPDDRRYAGLVGKAVLHPFDGRELPIVADRAVDPGFGTGAVKVTPAHDPLDFEIAERAGLPRLNILNPDGTIADTAAEEFSGLDRFEARRRVLEALRERGLVVAEERPYVHRVGTCYRCGTELEPWLSGEQWFVSVKRLKGPAREAAEDGRIRFHPEKWKTDYVTWLDNLRDWNISRQLWWGHRIPVWYCADGHEFASIEDPTACPRCGAQDVRQDPDVLDTWFSSQLWPFSTLGWPDEPEDLAFFYPTTILVTGYEILYLWVARMAMSGLYFMGDVPFGNVLIHGLVRDARGRKMSKSLGNVIDPLDLIGRHGADALRFSLSWMATGGQDIPFVEDAVEAARHFANKIWNAARLLSSAHRGGVPDLPEPAEWTLSERWVLSRHQACVDEVNAALEAYRFADAARSIHRFLWSEYCDWALELEKPRLYASDLEERHRNARVLSWVLERTLRLLHPIMPFLTEELWQRFAEGSGSIAVAPLPESHPEHTAPDVEADFAWMQRLVEQMRQVKAILPPGTSLFVTVGPMRAPAVQPFIPQIERMTGATVSISSDALADAQMALPETADREAVRAALDKRRARLRELAERSERKLGTIGFLEKAPPATVEEEKGKLASVRHELEQLEDQIEQLTGS
jgi:valyl-tRNA synthetase